MQTRRLASVSRTLFKSLAPILESEALLLGPVSVSDWTDWGFLIQTSQDSADTVITR